MDQPETLAQYLTRKTGFGRTYWVAFVIIVLFIALWFAVSASNYPEPGWWVAGSIAVLMVAILVGGTLSNLRTDRARAAQPRLNNHYPDVCEGCKPLRMKNGAPIYDFVIWAAAHFGISREQAAKYIHSTSARRLHNEYLEQFNPQTSGR